MRFLKKLLFALSLFILFPISANAETENSAPAENSPVAATEQTTPVEASSDNGTVDSSVTTESTSAAPADNSEVKDIQKAKDKTVEQIEKETGVKKSNDPVGNEQDPEKIREMLKDESMKSLISSSEVDGYSDQQLLNAMNLCQRISADTYGLDVGGYARILQALYKDNTLSWSKIENILNYNPNNYTNALEMIDQLDSLQAYLAALYPSNSSFMPIRQMSNQELTNVLKHISPLQEQMIGTQGNFFPGIIAWIARYAKDDAVRAGTTSSSTTDTSTTEESTASTTKSAENNAPAKNDKKDNSGSSFLPKTGEQRRTWLTVAGVIILALIAFIMVRRNRKK
ncbi:LPXTG cell wall anchor domain-containing protein [Enterococcus malodoratus]|uniref:LPXTG cell wall anchor domain-containing protein n=1 Tax=Enterococcus TaxID=1350 RepID=UPI0009100E0C|nr:LPXTG cell wall anchor domain-containing protein [Enterococcus malodoratus]OJG66059.1 LPXTG-domain-containing protein cell wall anchor domain [Enterococcus malodoratus]